VGESPSARTQRELADLRATIDRDIDALLAHVRSDVDPRNLVRRAPLAVLGSLASVATAAVLGVTKRSRDSKKAEATLDALLERVGDRVDRLKGKARKQFRKQLQKEMAEVDNAGPKDVAIEAVSGAITALAATMAQGFAKRLLGDGRGERDSAGR
jgi:hypothetical protein